MRISTIAPALLLLAACSKPPSTPPTTSTDPGGSPDPVTSPDPGGDEEPGVDAGSGQRPELTAAACEAQGGTVVGDIGDGAIHQPEYRCPDSGEAPLGSIVAEPGGPVAVEGSVCCK
jgi:hypothetical protein